MTTTRDIADRITTEQRLLLQAVLCAGADASDAYAAWRRGVDLGEIDPDSQRLLPLLARRLGSVGPEDPLRERVRGVYRHAWAKNQLVTRDAATLVVALSARAIPVMVLKGSALVRYYANDWGARPMHDVDLLVPPERLEEAVQVLVDHDWHPRHELTGAWLAARVASRRHSFPFSNPAQTTRDTLDLHWHVLAESLAPRADDRFWAAAEPLDLTGTTARALCPDDLLLHVITHGARQHGGVQWIADVVHVVRGTDDAFLGRRLADEARRHDQLGTVRAGLELIDELTAEPRIRPLLAHAQAARRGWFERIEGADRGRRSTSRAVAFLARAGGADEGFAPRAWHALHSALDLDLVRHPAAYLAYALAGRPAGLAGWIRRIGGSIAWVPGSTRTRIGEALDLTVPSVADRHCGPGWRGIDRQGIRSRGSEARIVLDVDAARTRRAHVDLVIALGSEDEQSRRIEVRVNEQPVGTLGAAALDDTVVQRLRVPTAVLRRFDPVEIAFLGERRGTLRRSRLGVRIARIGLEEERG